MNQKTKTIFVKGLALAISVSSIIAVSCSKEKICKTCNNSTETKELLIDNNPIVGQTSRMNNGASPSITYMHNNVKSYFKSVLDECPININTDNIIGVALFYPTEIKNYSDLKTSMPSAVLIYNKIQNSIITNCYFKNVNNSFDINSNLTGITSIISGNDLYKIDIGASLNSEEIVVLFDSKEIPEKSYASDFQIKTTLLAKPTPGDGNDPPVSKCSDVPECKSWGDTKGHCAFQESQNGPGGTICIEKDCGLEKTANLLLVKGFEIKPDVYTNLYSLRDNFLGKSNSGSRYIDNFYYASTFINYSNLTMDFLLNSYQFTNSNLINKLGNIGNPKYADSVLIKSEDKLLLLSIFKEAKNMTTDQRFQNILVSLESDLNKYENKKIIEIKNDF